MKTISDNPLKSTEIQKLKSVKQVSPYPKYTVELDRLYLPYQLKTIPSIVRQKNEKAQRHLYHILAIAI